MPLPPGPPTITPGPTITDDLLPITTLGCCEARLERVPSGQIIASPVKTPRRPSSQVTSLPSLVHFWARAGLAQIVAIVAASTASANFGVVVMASPAGFVRAQISR